MTRAPSAARLVSDSRWNLIAFCVSLVSNVVSLPLAIGAIGLERFGVAGLVMAGFAPFSVLGAILGQCLVKDLARPAARDDERVSRRLIGLTASACLLGTALVALASVAAGLVLLHAWRPAGLSSTALTAVLAWGYAAWFLQQWSFLMQGALSGRQNFRALALAQAASGILMAASVVIACRLTGSEAGFLAGTAIGFLLQLLLLAAAVARTSHALLRPLRWTPAESSALRRFFGWQGSAHFSGSVANQIDRYVLGLTAPGAVVGQYNVAMRVQEVVHMGVLKAGEVLLPHFSSTSSQPAPVRAAFYRQASWVVNVVSVAALAPLIPFGPALITLWIDARAASLGGTMLQTLATAGVIGSGINVFTFFALGTDQSVRLATINLAHSVLLVGLAILLIALLGPLAAGWAYVVSNLMRWSAAFWFSLKHFGTHMRPGPLAWSSAAPMAIGLLLGWGISNSHGPMPTTWVGLAVAYLALAVGLVVITALATSLSAEGRGWLQAARARLERRKVSDA